MLTNTFYVSTLAPNGTESFAEYVAPAPPTGRPAAPAGLVESFGVNFADYADLAAFQRDWYLWAGLAKSSPATFWDCVASLHFGAPLSNGAKGMIGKALPRAGGLVTTFGFGRKRSYVGEVGVKVHCRRPAFPGLKRNGGIWWATDGKEPGEEEDDMAEDDGTGTSLDINRHQGSTWPANAGSAHLGNIDTTKWGVLGMYRHLGALTTTWTPDGGATSQVSLAMPTVQTAHNMDVQVEALKTGLVIPPLGVDFEFDWWQELVPA
jgi:hypothetical protein